MTAIDSFIQFSAFKVRISGTSEEPLFCAKDLCDVLGIANNRDAIGRIKGEFISSVKTTPGRGRGLTFLKEPGLYMLIMRSRKPQAAPFQNWVCGEVLPCLRKYGCYPKPESTVAEKHIMNVETEFDLQVQVVRYIREYINLDISVGLGENQDTSEKRIKSKMLGYVKGTPDIVLHDLTEKYNGFALELKTPKGTGEVSAEQHAQLRRYRDKGYYCLVSNDLFEIIHALQKYHKAVQKYCPICRRAFASKANLRKHMRKYHTQEVIEEESEEDFEEIIDSEEDLSEYTVSYESGEG